MKKQLSEVEINELKKAQLDELLSTEVYKRLSNLVKDPHNAKILKQIAKDEQKHTEIFQKYTGVVLKVNRLKVLFYVFVARFLGLTFGVKLQERGEEEAQETYRKIINVIPEMEEIIEEEEKHEDELINLINEERLSYMSSVVLGLNDALVELTGALAGFTLSIQNSRIIAILGLITGISASLSMAASEYLSTRAESDPKEQQRAGKSALYTGFAYILTVIALVAPYFLINNYIISLIMTVTIALIIIFLLPMIIISKRDFLKWPLSVLV